MAIDTSNPESSTEVALNTANLEATLNTIASKLGHIDIARVYYDTRHEEVIFFLLDRRFGLGRSMLVVRFKPGYEHEYEADRLAAN